MDIRFYFLMGSVALLGGLAPTQVMAADAVVTTTTQTITPAADGSVVYEKHSVTAPTPTTLERRPIIFYYYDAKSGQIVAADTMSKDIFKIWDKDGNGYISPQEFYADAMIMYEPVETKTEVFSDVHGRMKLTQEEYTLRLQRLPGYADINKDGKPGISAAEFVGAGFQEADDNDDNQVSYDELVEQFYGQPRLASEPERYNQ